MKFWIWIYFAIGTALWSALLNPEAWRKDLEEGKFGKEALFLAAALAILFWPIVLFLSFRRIHNADNL